MLKNDTCFQKISMLSMFSQLKAGAHIEVCYILLDHCFACTEHRYFSGAARFGLGGIATTRAADR